MNKTIIININGFVFHIEEDAYEILKAYMTDVKRHFLNSADSYEITSDIENRIAEMFTEILERDSKQAVLEEDVKDVIEQMGSVADFDYPEDGAEGPHDTYAYTTGSRTLFRDGEDHLLGGVCAGLANYFDSQPVWFRLAFAISFFFFGSGFILYMILWIVIPKAVTRADKLTMKGHKPNLQGFKKSIEDEMGSVGETFDNMRHEARPLVYKTRDFVGEFFRHLGMFFTGAGKVFVKLFGVIILIACFSLLIGLIITIIGFLAYGKMGLYHIFPFNVLESRLNTMVLTAAFLLLAIPLFAIIMVTISMVFNNNGGLNRSAGTTLLIIWLVTLGVVVYYTAMVSADFRHEETFIQNVSIKPTANNTYYLRLNDVKYLSAEDSIRLNIKDHFNNRVIIDDDDNNGDDFESPRNVRITIEKSDIDKPVLMESFSARGRDDQDALLNAQNTTYQFAQQDSVLKFNKHLEKPLNRLWRDQEVHLTLKIPVNAKVVFDRNIENYLENVDIYQCKVVNKKQDAPTSTFVMTTDGLQCKVDTLVTSKPSPDNIRR